MVQWNLIILKDFNLNNVCVIIIRIVEQKGILAPKGNGHYNNWVMVIITIG